MANSSRNPVLHNRQPSVYAGSYQVTDEALKNYKVSRDKFGSTDVKLPDGTVFNVKDYQYILDNGDVGMYLMPVSEYGTFTDADGKVVWAAELVDAFIRSKMNILQTDPLYAYVYYIHPELTNMSIQEFLLTEKAEMGVTHLGAYYGQGVTSNSPSLYHNRTWGVVGTDIGYPCNLMIISMDGVDQAMLNKNFLLTDKFINDGVRFPKDYKHSAFRMIDINTCLMFYRDWIQEKDYLRTDKSWFTYCAAHKTLVTTVALNLPHNRKSFMEVYGEKDGSDFFDLFCTNHFALFGEDFNKENETDFEPLWKKQGFTAAQIKPFTFEEYNAYDSARRESKLDTFKGFRPLEPTQATGWGPQYTADVIFDFVEAYADFIDAGAVVSCATIMAYKDQVVERMGISEKEYLMTAMPILEIMMQAHAMIYAPVDPNTDFEKSQYYMQAFQGLYIGYGGKKENTADAMQHFGTFKQYENDLLKFVEFLQTDEALPEFLAWWSLGKVRENWSTIIARTVSTPEDAYEWMKNEASTFFKNSEKIIASKDGKIEFNTPPAIAHMIEIGMFDKNPFIHLKTICTVMSYTELEPKK